MPTLQTLNEKPAAAIIRDGLNLVLSTTHSLGKKQADVSYHADCPRV